MEKLNISQVRTAIHDRITQIGLLIPALKESEVNYFEENNNVLIDKLSFYYLCRISAVIYINNRSEIFNYHGKTTTGEFEYVLYHKITHEELINKGINTSNMGVIANSLPGVYLISTDYDDGVFYFMPITGKSNGQVWSIKEVNNEYELRMIYTNLVQAAYETLCGSKIAVKNK